MNREEFITNIREHQPDLLAETYLAADTVTAFPNPVDYASFKTRVHQQLAGVESLSIVGTGNWRFSLNPDKGLKEFDRTSDIDIAVVSSEQFNQTWEELRRVHRSRWYTLPHAIREKIRRNAEDVYAGFITPMWIPGDPCELRYRFKTILNQLRDASVQFKPIKMLFFKNEVEAIDYYKRGFLLAKKKVERDEI
ncbi:MAG TPA: hypothetical protein VEW46_16570 [Pyrinomonadaceae bacterium]|nr:hypothetical protein [Pyrinomonadaceae bacterium]